MSKMNGNQLLVLAAAYIGVAAGPSIGSGAEAEATAALWRRGLLVNKRGENQLTEKGHVFIEMLLTAPDPVASWKDPRK